MEKTIIRKIAEEVNALNEAITIEVWGIQHILKVDKVIEFVEESEVIESEELQLTFLMIERTCESYKKHLAFLMECGFEEGAFAS